mgnify:CR=1 FL=1
MLQLLSPEGLRAVAAKVAALPAKKHSPAVQAYGSGVLDTIVAGDLQGNVWKLSFRLKGVDSLGTDGLLNLSTLNAMGSNHDPFFIARAADGTRQPITSAPLVANAFGGKRLIVVGTGKFLEASDNTAPVNPATSVYALLDGNGAIDDRERLSGADPLAGRLRGNGKQGDRQQQGA